MAALFDRFIGPKLFRDMGGNTHIDLPATGARSENSVQPAISDYSRKPLITKD